MMVIDAMINMRVKINLKTLFLQDVIASIHANRCLQLFPSRPENEGNAIEDLYIQANAIKGLVELVKGNIVSGQDLFLLRSLLLLAFVQEMTDLSLFCISGVTLSHVPIQ